MIQEYIINPYLNYIIENTYINKFIATMLIVMLGYAFTLTITKGTTFVWRKLFMNS